MLRQVLCKLVSNFKIKVVRHKLGHFAFCQNFRLEISESFRVKWKGFFPFVSNL